MTGPLYLQHLRFTDMDPPALRGYARFKIRTYYLLHFPLVIFICRRIVRTRGIDSVPNFSISISKSGFRVPFQTIFRFQTVWKWKWKWKINVDVPVLGATCICGTVKCAANQHARTCTRYYYGGFYFSPVLPFSGHPRKA
jgi:hypothetical protein